MAPFAAALALLALTDFRPAPRAPAAPLDRPVARIGGVCLPCPEVDFGPLVPQAPSPLSDWQRHEARLESASDCAWYSFEVVSGTSYAFSTCAPGFTDWDTVLELHDPASCGTPLRVNDDACSPGRGSLLLWDATFTGQVHLKVASRSGFGDYVLAYRAGSQSCPGSCAAPMGGLSPDADCHCISAELSPACPTHWYTISLRGTVMITTCPDGGCAAGSTPGTRLRLWNSACTTILTQSDHGCTTPGAGDRAVLRYATPTTGLYKLEVGGDADASGTRAWGPYTICASDAPCDPSAIVLAPLAGATQGAGCSRTQDFAVAVQSMAALPVQWEWSITPAPGGTAFPASGRMSSGATAGAATFRSRLTGRGIHQVHLTASNACGRSSVDAPYELIDATAPFVRAPAGGVVECPDAPAPASPQVRDNCDPAPDVALVEQVVPGLCPSEYALRRTWTATDDAGNASAPAVQVVRVRDVDPPVVTPDATVAHCVHPPDHGRACFTFTDFTPLATDACPGPIAWVFARVTHDEEAMGACDPPDEAPDVEIAPDGSSFCVRAERCVDDDTVSPGRAYLVEAIATDACGNASPPTPIATILVPQDSADTTACRVPVPW